LDTAKVVSICARPFLSSHVCFEVDGIIGECKVELGATVNAFDFDAFYTTLRSFPTFGPAALFFDADHIRGHASPFLLAALRSEARKATLDKAMNSRFNAFCSKYIDIPALVARMTADYSPTFVGVSKPDRLARLRTLSQQQADLLNKAYNADQRTGVVRSTESKVHSVLKSDGTSTGTGRSDDTSVGLDTLAPTFPAPPEKADDSEVRVVGDGLVGESRHLGTSFQTSTSAGSASEDQKVVNTDYGYRIPFLESQAQNERAQISLIDEQFALFMNGISLPNLGQIFAHELNSIDSDVLQLQIAYLNTLLMSPIAGTVTGIYKNPGESVRAGEPVIRVENNTDVYLEGTVIFGGLISIGSNIRVQTNLFDRARTLTPVSGHVVAARGQDDDDRWDIVAKCSNVRNGRPILPLGYHFDYDNTTVDFPV
jgi:hypothetical protein